MSESRSRSIARNSVAIVLGSLAGGGLDILWNCHEKGRIVALHPREILISLVGWSAFTVGLWIGVMLPMQQSAHEAGIRLDFGSFWTLAPWKRLLVVGVAIGVFRIVLQEVLRAVWT